MSNKVWENTAGSTYDLMIRFLIRILFIVVWLIGSTATMADQPVLPGAEQSVAIAHQFMQGLARGIDAQDLSEFYRDHASSQSVVTAEKFEAAFRMFWEKGFDLSFIHSQTPVLFQPPFFSDEETLTLMGYYFTPSNETFRFHIDCMHEEATWKIKAIEVGSSVPISQAPLPSDNELYALVHTSTTNLSTAIQSNEFANLYNQSSQILQHSVSLPAFAEALKSMAEDDWSFLTADNLVISAAPQAMEHGQLAVAGYYPRAKDIWPFQITYVYEHPHWKTLGFSAGASAKYLPQSAPSGPDMQPVVAQTMNIVSTAGQTGESEPFYRHLSHFMQAKNSRSSIKEFAHSLSQKPWDWKEISDSTPFLSQQPRFIHPLKLRIFGYYLLSSGMFPFHLVYTYEHPRWALHEFLIGSHANIESEPPPEPVHLNHLIASTIRDFSEALQHQNFTQFYQQTSQSFQTSFSLEHIQQVFPPFIRDQRIDFSELRTHEFIRDVPPSFAPNGLVLQVSGYYPEAGRIIEVSLGYVYETSDWKLANIDISTYYALLNAQPLAPPADHTAVLTLTNSTMHEVLQALASQEFAPLYETLASVWKEDVTPEQFAADYGRFSGYELTTDDIQHIEPVFTRKPLFMEEGMLILHGYYPAETDVVPYFSLKYVAEDNGWRLFNIHLSFQENKDASKP